MSSTESSGPRGIASVKAGLDPRAIDGFAKTGLGDSSLLADAHIHYDMTKDNPNDHPLGYFTSKGQDISGLVGTFNDWLKKSNDSYLEHDAYLKLTKEKPGRAGTVLTPLTSQQSQTILGASSPQMGKTVLG